MNAEGENSRSLWMEERRPHEAWLGASDSADVLVVGSGIAGLSIAYELALQGKSVIVLDRGPIGRGMTARTSAHLAFQPDDSYSELIKAHGEQQARQYYLSQSAAIDRCEEILRDERIDCDFARVDGFLFAADAEGRQQLEQEIEAAHRVGYAAVQWADAPVAGPTHGCLRFPRQARFHPLRYLDALARAIAARGGRFFADTNVTSIKEEKGGITAETERGHKVTAQYAVAATNSPFVDRYAMHTKQAPYRCYVITAPVPKKSVPDALIWDTEDPYHYVRLQPGEHEDLLIIGGEDHKTGAADDMDARLARLHGWAAKRFPRLGEMRHRWSGQVFEPVDYVPYIGRNPGNERVFIVTGDSGDGLSAGLTAALLIPDLIAGRDSPWTALYDPSRKPLKPAAAVSYVEENLSAASHLVEHITPAEVDIDSLKPGQAGLVRVGLQKGAAYRDEEGALHLVTATCPHAKCIVHWNSFERCWDCPCHGSHFDIDGTVLQGPAYVGLEKLQRK